jgi:hemoglobin
MKGSVTTLLLLAVLAAGPAAAAETPDADAQVADLERMCEASAEARAERHAARTLYERLGREAGINQLTTEIVRLHHENEAINHLFEGTHDETVAQRVADFMVSGLGGPAVYENRPTLPDSHRHMHLTNADFMAAGADVIQAMQNLDYGQDEIDEVVCTLVGLRHLVVLDEKAH